jgi:hypothetical protein
MAANMDQLITSREREYTTGIILYIIKLYKFIYMNKVLLAYIRWDVISVSIVN